MRHKKPSDYKNIYDYNKYVLDHSKTIEWAFFFTANGNNLNLEWQKQFSCYTSNGGTQTISCDFYYEDNTGDIKIAIECDDITHKTKTVQDAIRDEMLTEQKGVKVFRFPAKEIIWNCLKCVNEVKMFIHRKRKELEKKSYNRKFKQQVKFSVREISKKRNPQYQYQIQNSIFN